MNVVRHTADAVALAIAMTGNRGEVSVELRADFRREKRHAVLGAEDHVEEIQAKGLWHKCEG
jgi:hypothetical protein